MVAVMMSGFHWAYQTDSGSLTVGYAEAALLLTILIVLSLAIGFTAEWIYRRPAARRVSLWAATAGLVMIAVYWPYYWFWGCFC